MRYYNVEAWRPDVRQWLVAGWPGASRKAVLREVNREYPHATCVRVKLAKILALPERL